MERMYLVIFSVLVSLLVGVIGYWLKTGHKEFKELIHNLTLYTNQLKGLIIGIQMQLEKGVEADIQELKTEVKELQADSTRHQSQITALNEKVKSNE